MSRLAILREFNPFVVLGVLLDLCYGIISIMLPEVERYVPIQTGDAEKARFWN